MAGLFDDLPDAPSTGVTPSLTNKVKQFEGFNPRAYGDYKQTSVGYGTKGVPGQVVDEATATQMLNSELARHAGRIDGASQHFGISLAPNQREALISFDYNTGAGDRILAQAGGDLTKVPKLMSQFVHVTNPDGSKSVLPGLVNRRNEEASMFLGQPFNGASSFSQLQPPADEIVGSVEPFKPTDISGLFMAPQTAPATPKTPAAPAPAGGMFEDLPDAPAATQVAPQGGMFDDLPEATAAPQPGVQAQAPQSPEVGFLEAAGRTAGSALLSVPEYVNRAVGLVPYAADKVAELTTGQSPGWSQGYQDYMVNDLANRRKGLDIKAAEKLTTPGKIGAAVGPLARDLPLIAATGGLYEVPAAASIGARMLHGAVSMAPTAGIAGGDKVNEVLERGGSTTEAIAKGIGQAGITAASGAVPMAVQSGAATLPGRVLSRTLQGTAVAAPVGAVARQAEQLMDGQPVTGMSTDDLISSIPMGVIAGVTGGRAKAPGERPPMRTAFDDLAAAEAAAKERSQQQEAAAARGAEVANQAKADSEAGLRQGPEIYAGESVPDIFADLPNAKSEPARVEATTPETATETPASEPKTLQIEQKSPETDQSTPASEQIAPATETPETTLVGHRTVLSGNKRGKRATYDVVEIRQDAEGNEVIGKKLASGRGKQAADEIRRDADRSAGFAKRAPSKGDGGWSEDPVIAYLNENPMMSKTEAKRAKRYEKLKGEYDGSEDLLVDPRHNSIFGGNATPDVTIQSLMDLGLMPEGSSTSDLWSYVAKKSRSATETRKAQSAQMKEWAKQEKAAAREAAKRAKQFKEEGFERSEDDLSDVPEDTTFEFLPEEPAPAEPAPAPEIPENIRRAQETLAKLEASGNGDGQQAKILRKSLEDAGYGERPTLENRPEGQLLAEKDMPFNLTGEVDTSATPAEKAAADTAAAEKAANEKAQGDLFTPPKEDRAAKLEKRKELVRQAKEIVGEDMEKINLSASEAEKFKAISKEIRDLDFDLVRRPTAEKLASMEERKSTLPFEVVASAWDGVRSNKAIYDAISEASDGTHINRDTAVDDIMNGKNPDVSARDLYDAFSKTREELRKTFGDTITLFRSEGKQKEKATKNWTTTEAAARDFQSDFKNTNPITRQEVPIDNVIAVNVGPRGTYHEVIVGKPPEPSLGQKLDAWADKTIKDSKGRLNMGVDPVVTAAYVLKGARLIQRGVTDFAKWSKAMIDEFGDKVRPHLKSLFQQAQNYHAAEIAAEAHAAGGAASTFQSAADTARQKLMSAAGTIRDFAQVSFSQNAARMETLISRVKDPEARALLQGLADQMHTSPGKNRAVNANTYHEDVSTNLTKFKNELDKAFQPYLEEIRAMSMEEKTDFMSRVGQLLTQESSREIGGKFGKMLDDIRDLQAKLLEYQRAAGVEIGERDNYLKRVLNEEAVAANQDKFLTQAAKVYEAMGMAPDEAAGAANAYLARILHSVAGIRGEGENSLKFESGNGTPKHTERRELGPEADTLLKDFYYRDVQDILSSQIHAAVQMSEFSRRFGQNSEKWDSLVRDLAKKKVSPEIIREVREIILSQTGGYRQYMSRGARALTDTISLGNLIGFMARSTYGSLSEPIVTAMRSGKMRDIWGSYVNSVREAVNIVRGKDPSDAALLAEDLGLINSALSDQALSARFMMEDSPNNNWTRKLGNNFMRRIGLIQWTEGTKIAANMIAQRHLNRLAEDLTAGRRSNLVARELRSLGIDDADHKAFAEFVRGLTSKGQGVREAIMDEKSPEAALYRRALIRFNRESIMEPSAADRPRPATHPVYRTAFGLMGYLYSFSRNVNTRIGGMAREAISRKSDLSTSERLALLKPLAFLPIMAAAQVGLGELRDKIWNDPSRKYQPEKSLRSKLWMAVSRANILGKWDFPFNVFNIPGAINHVADKITGSKAPASEARRYQKDPATALLGPTVGLASEGLQSTVGLFSDQNSDRTNTQERKATRNYYDIFAKPALGALLSSGTVPPALGALGIQVANHPAVREGIVATVAGPAAAPKGLGDALGGRGSGSRGNSSRGASSRGAGTR